MTGKIAIFDKPSVFPVLVLTASAKFQNPSSSNERNKNNDSIHGYSEAQLLSLRSLEKFRYAQKKVIESNKI